MNTKRKYLNKAWEQYERGKEHKRRIGLYDAVKTNELLLSEISSIAHQIEVNPRNVLNIPEKFFKDKKLIERLFEHSLDCAAAAGDQEYLHDTKRYSDFLAKKLENKPENLENGKRRFYCQNRRQ